MTLTIVEKYATHTSPSVSGGASASLPPVLAEVRRGMIDAPLTMTRPGHANCNVCPSLFSCLFAAAPRDELEQLVEPIEKFQIDAKMALYKEGTTAKFVYFIREGLVKLVHTAVTGKPRIVRFLTPGAIADLEALTGDHYHHRAESLLPTEVCRVPLETLKDLVGRDMHLFGELMQRWQKGLSSADDVIARLSTGQAQGRVARFLLHTLCGPDGDNCIALSREDLSALLGVTVETASRVVADFKRKRILKERRGWFYFDRAGLQEFATL